MEKLSMSRVRWLTVVAMATALLPAAARAQQTGTISGQVSEAGTQRPLGGAQVAVVGTSRVTRTDAAGRYTLSGVPAGTQRVVTSLVGYAEGSETVTVAAGSTASANFSLTPSAVQISGIVVNAVTGQEEARRELGTNVANVSASDIATAPITKPADVLTGRVPGVNVATSGGTAGTSQRIRIRGANSLSLSNEPLIYVDGVLFSNQLYAIGEWGQGAGGSASSRLNDINPQDIENIEVLKGPAATSQYGTEAANGVILITTKRGTSGHPRWTVYSELGSVTDPTDYPANWSTYQVNNPNQPLFRASGSVNLGATPETSTARLVCPNYLAGAGACTQDSTAVFNTLEDPRTTPFSTGNREKYGASVSGGSSGTTYFVSADRERERGVVAFNVLQKNNVRANLNANVTDKLKLQVSSGYVDSDLVVNSNDNTVFSTLINGLNGRAFFNPDTTTAIFNRNYRLFSPQALSEWQPTEHVNRLTLGGQANYSPLDWLTLNGNGGLDFTNRFYELTLQPGRSLGAIAPDFYGIGFRDVQRTNNFLWTTNGSATATHSWTDALSTTTTAGVSFQRQQYRTLQNEGAGTVEGTEDIGAATGQYFLDEDFNETRTIGGFLSQQFAWQDRLFLTLGIRTDKNSAFGTDFGFAKYPNANASWVVNEEPWFPQTEILTNLRLRAGYGTSGLRPTFRDAITLYGPAGVQVSGADLPGVILDATGNTGLKPERTSEFEGGFDAGWFGDRISTALTYYHKESKDALIEVPLPPSFGLTATRWANLGKIRNSGLELGVDARVLDMENTKLDLRLSTTTLNNKIQDIGGVNDIIVNRGEQRHRVGFPAGAYFQDPYTIKDNGDGKLALDPEEVAIVDAPLDDKGNPIPHYIGPSLPTHTNALTADLTIFKYVTISTLFEERGGNYQLDGTSEFRCIAASQSAGQGCAFTNDPNASLDDQARFVADALYGTVYGYIYPADFVKWRELSVTFGVPESLSRSSALLRGATLTLSGRNLHTWTDYPGFDPEITESASGNFSQNEFNTAPPVRYFSARLNFTF
jgi:TonB-linked SusC/RagA family outer membrane protein